MRRFVSKISGAKMRGLYSRAVSLALFVLFSATSLAAQTSNTTSSPPIPKLRGTVKDPSGATMSAVDIVLVQNLKVVKTTKTNETGFFSLDVPAGGYDLGITAPDFKVYTKAIRVVPNMEALSIMLDLEGVNTAVEVVGNSNQI